jgi:hypothetical protein
LCDYEVDIKGNMKDHLQIVHEYDILC